MTQEPTPHWYELEGCVRDAVWKIDDFIRTSTGQRATQAEIAAALTRYFVLREIVEFIQMERQV
jgi:hypothetical protein